MIPPKIRPVLKRKSIHPVAVSTLEQALDILLHSSMEADPIERRHTGPRETQEHSEPESEEPSQTAADPRPAMPGRTILAASALIFLAVFTLCVLFFMSQTPRTDGTTPTAEQKPVEVTTDTAANKPAKADSKGSSTGKGPSFEIEDLTESKKPDQQNPSTSDPEQNNSSAEKEKKKDKKVILDQGFE